MDVILYLPRTGESGRVLNLLRGSGLRFTIRDCRNYTEPVATFDQRTIVGYDDIKCLVDELVGESSQPQEELNGQTNGSAVL